MRKLLRRIKQAVSYTDQRPRIVFLHVPKTGGTSLDGALERLYPLPCEANLSFRSVTRGWRLAASFASEDSVGAQSWLEVMNVVLCYKIARGAPYLSGHFGVTEELLTQARQSYRFVTLLRDPADRWKSNYVYSRIREAQDGKREVPRDIGLELEEYLSSPQALSEGAKYVRYLGGFTRAERLRKEEVIESAKRLLDRFDAVGVLENLSRFEERLSCLVNVQIKVPHLRKTETFREPGGNTSADYKALFTPEIMERVRALCEPDYEIYRHAKEIDANGEKQLSGQVDKTAQPSGHELAKKVKPMFS